ncbi:MULTISPECIES: c-type cytochrome [unclassified Yoonia]|uniref:c-type cytochrome n=1 Tax=unclassified Yoonia TaxID=2629118 RepID=UPI002AFFF9C5|nr:MULTISPECIES: c-type cytochrome [unclassified Yoonia]
MFDTMTVTKAVGALCATLLVYLLGAWLASSIYFGGGHGDAEQAYAIAVESAEEAEGEAGEEVDFAEVMASASAADGEALWRNCRSCHALESGVHGTGPALYGVVGRQVQFYDDFAYSGALIEVNDVWDPESLNAFLENPRGYAPGTSMGYNGMRSVTDRANLIAYLDSIDD